MSREKDHISQHKGKKISSIQSKKKRQISSGGLRATSHGGAQLENANLHEEGFGTNHE